MTFVDDQLFYEGSDNRGIYFFRAGKAISGTIQKLTGKKDDFITLDGSYKIQWNKLKGVEY